MNRRAMLLGAAGASVAAAGSALFWNWRMVASARAGEFEIVKTDEEWRAILTDAEYEVLRQEKTERAFTSDLLHEERAGTFTCAGCDLPLYSSKAKYDSGTGWPSFWKPLPNAVATRTDYKLFLPRTEVHCRRCGGHLGHVFDDGPPPTGKRYCMNGVALDFVPDDKAA